MIKIKINDSKKFKWAYDEYVRKYRFLFFINIILKTLSGILGFIPPIFIGMSIDFAISKNIKNVFINLFIIMLSLIMNSVISIFETKIQIKITYSVTNNIKKKIINKFLHMQQADINRIHRGEFLSRLDDADNIVQGFMEISTLVFIDMLTFVFALVIMFYISPLLSTAYLVNIPVIFLLQNYYGKKIAKKEEDVKHSNDNYYSILFEIIDAIKEIKIFNLENVTENKYKDKLEESTKLHNEKAKYTIKANFWAVIVNGFFQLIVLAFGCIFIISNIISVGSYFTFNSYVSRFSIEFQTISQFLINKHLYIVSITRLQELFSYTDECSYYNDIKLNIDYKLIKLKDVIFKYENTNNFILNIKDLSFERNQITVIKGKNGNGKSTLFNLIMGFYSFEGCIFINDININTISLKQRRKAICYIQQKPYFFNGTILYNLQLARSEATLKEIEDVCKIVGIDNFIRSLEDEYYTIINELGCNFSGGQLQRLALARAVISKADFILLDEITSGIDIEGKEDVYKAIEKLKENSSVVIISHDPDIYKIADKIIYMENGRVKKCEKKDL
jgi:ABC-type bacteriocin/lantibiotic exporter with double-glycine peptidase domain